MKKEDRITAEFVRELFHYDPETGVFTRRITRQGIKARAGDIAGTLTPKGYINIWICGANFRAHRLAWLYVHGAWPDGQLDHINQVKDDNRIANLRIADHAENMHNRSVNRNNTTGFRGVYYRAQRRRYQAFIGLNGKTHYLGLFKTPEEAHAAYCAAAAALHPFNPAAQNAPKAD